MDGLYNYNTNDINLDTQNGELDTSSNVSFSGDTAYRAVEDPVGTDRDFGGEVEDYDLAESEAPEGYEVYVAKDGDTFSILAKVYDIDEDDLRKINSNIKGEITEGDLVYVPMKALEMGETPTSGGGGGAPISNESSVPSTSGGGGGGRSASSDMSYDYGDGSGNNYSTDYRPSSGDYNNDGSQVPRGSYSPYAHSTSDLRNLNLDELQEIADSYKSRLAELKERSEKLKEERSNLMNMALSWFASNVGSASSSGLTNEEIFDLFLKNNQSSIKEYATYDEYSAELDRINEEIEEINRMSKEVYIVMLQRYSTEQQELEMELESIYSIALEWASINGIAVAEAPESDGKKQQIIDMYLSTHPSETATYRSYAEFKNRISELQTEIDNTSAIIINYVYGYDNPEEGIVAMYRNIYTDEMIDSLDIDSEYKEKLKNCLKNEDEGSLILVVSLINDAKTLEAAEARLKEAKTELSQNAPGVYNRVSQADAERVGQIEREKAQKRLELQDEISMLEAQIKSLRMEMESLENQLTLMQYQDYFNQVQTSGTTTNSLAYVKEFFADNPDLLEYLKSLSEFEDERREMGGNPSDEEIALCVLMGYYGNTAFLTRIPGDGEVNELSYYFNSNVKGRADIDVMAFYDVYCKYFPPYENVPNLGGIVDYTEASCWYFLTDEEKEVYHAILEQEGGLAAYQYLEDISFLVDQRYGYQTAKNYYEYVIRDSSEFGRLAREGWVGVKQGLKGHFENIFALFSGDHKTTATEYATQYFLQMMANAYSVAELGKIDDAKLTELYNQVEEIDGQEYHFLTDEEYAILKDRLNMTGSLNGYDILLIKGLISDEEYDYSTRIYNQGYFKTFMETYGGEREKFLANCFFSAGNSTGNMLPSILLSIMCQPLGAAFTIGNTTVTWGQIAANVSMFLSATGSAWKEARRGGNSQMESLLYGILSGTSEVGVGFLLGRVPYVSRISRVTEDLAKGQGNILAKAALALLSDICGEVTEEITQIFIEGGLKKIILHDDVKLSDLFAQIPETVISTIISTGALNGMTAIIQVGSTVISISPQDAIDILLAKDSEAFLQALIAAKTNNTEVLNELINSDRISDREKAIAISRLSSDAAKLEFLSNMKDQEAIDSIIMSMKSDREKINALKYASEDTKIFIASLLDVNSINSEEALAIVKNDEVLRYFTPEQQQSIFAKVSAEVLISELESKGLIVVTETNGVKHYIVNMENVNNSDTFTLDSIVLGLRSKNPNSDIIANDGTVLFLAEYDYVNTLVVYNLQANTGNTALDNVNTIDVMSIIQQMRQYGYPRETILNYIDSVDNARAMILEGIIGYDETVNAWDVVQELDKLFHDGGEIGRKIQSLKTSSPALSGAEIKAELLKDSSLNPLEVERFFNETEVGRWFGSLTADEIQAIIYYSNSYFDQMNKFMRGQPVSNPTFIEKITNDLRSAIAKYPPLSTNMLLYRGTTESFALTDPALASLVGGLSADANPNEVCAAFQAAAGMTLTTGNTLSTSPGYNTSFAKWASKSVVLEILAPPGTSGAYINVVSDFYNSENEYLLAEGANLTILNSYIGADGKVHVQLIVDPNGNQPKSDTTIDMNTYRNYRNVVQSISDRVNNAIASSSFVESGYYELTNIIGEYVARGEKVPANAIIEVINSNKQLRESIVAGARSEIRDMLSTMYGISGTELDTLTDEFVNDLTGGDIFIAFGLGNGIDWQHFVTEMKPRFVAKLKELVAAGKVPIFWSGIDDQYHGLMNDKFATIENTTIGDLGFINVLYPNWNEVGSPMLESFWGMLSDVYAEAINELVDPATGGPYTNIPFVYPSSMSTDDCFGHLFESVEFPAILENGNITKITMVKVNPETMEVLETIEVDINDIREYYNKKHVKGVNDPVLNEEVLKMLQEKIRNGEYIVVNPDDCAILHPQVGETANYTHIEGNKVVIDVADLEAFDEEYDYVDIVPELMRLYPGKDIVLDDGTVLYDSEYDFVNDLFVPGAYYTDHGDMEELCEIDTMSIVQQMKADGVPRDQIANFIKQIQRAKDIIRNNEVISFDGDVDEDDVVEALGKIFDDNSPIARAISGEIRFGETDLNRIKESLLNHYPTSFTQAEIDDFFNNTVMGRYLSSLTSAELWAIHLYTDTEFEAINAAMRGENTDPKYVKLAADLRSALAKFTLSETLYLYKGDTASFALCDPLLTDIINSLGPNPTNAEIAEALQSVVGVDITTQNTWSTSPGYNTSFAAKPDYNVVLEILAPPGTPGAYINIASGKFYNTENEFLMDSGIKLTILNSYVGADGKVHVQMIVTDGT